MNKTIQIISAILAGTAGLLFGNINGILFALIVFIIFDYTTGVLVAIVKKTLSSAVGFKGIAKKVIILLLVAVGHILGTYVLGGGEACRDMVIGFYLANEGISILENAAKLGLPLPKKLVEILAQLKKNEE
jgi:toxin secretion/phage lysis holin